MLHTINTHSANQFKRFCISGGRVIKTYFSPCLLNSPGRWFFKISEIV